MDSPAGEVPGAVGTIPGALHGDKVCRGGDVSPSPEGRVGVSPRKRVGEVLVRPAHGPGH